MAIFGIRVLVEKYRRIGIRITKGLETDKLRIAESACFFLARANGASDCSRFRVREALARRIHRLALGFVGSSGWVLLTYVPRDARLINHISAGHEQGLARSIPILAWACTSMPYHPEFGANPAAYVAAFMRNIDWDTALVQYQNAVKVKPPPPLIQKQFADLPSITVEEVKGMLDSGKAVQVIDTRPRHYTTRAHEIVWGAVWRDPERDRRTVNC